MRRSPLSAMAWLSVVVVFVAGPAGAQMRADSVEIDIVGSGILPTPGGPDEFLTVELSSITDSISGAPELILDSSGYEIVIEGVVETRIGGALIEPLSGEIRDLFALLSNNAGINLLNNFVRTPESGPRIWREGFGGSFGSGFFSIDIELNFEVQVEPDGEVRIIVGDVTSSLGQFLEIEVVSGSAIVRTWDESRPQLTEWHFDGDLAPAEGSAAARIRYLDDPAFGPVLGGSGSPNTPRAATPTGVTRAQSAFVDTASDPALPPVGSADDVVYRTSPTFNRTDPGSEPLRRGIGLAFWPALKPAYPGNFVGPWTLVLDALIPDGTFYTDAPSNTDPRFLLAPIFNQNPSNAQPGDLWLLNRGSGVELIYSRQAQDLTGAPGVVLGVGPGEWFRLAIATDEFLTGRASIFVDGVFVGMIPSDWMYNALDPTDGERAFVNGDPVTDADWLAWGEFPNPWARTFGDDGTPFALTAGVTLFSDIGFDGDGPVYLANMLFVDRVLPDAQVAALGGADADGIVLTKSGGVGCNAPDVAEPFGVLDAGDARAVLDLLAVNDPSGDVNSDGNLDFFDALAAFTSIDAGCP